MTRVTLIFFFFQAEDGIRDVAVTGVQTCALPILHHLPQPTPWPRVSFGSWRLWDAYVVWPNVEPQKGQWDFEVREIPLPFLRLHVGPDYIGVPKAPGTERDSRPGCRLREMGDVKA